MIKEVKPKTTAEHNDDSSSSASKAQKPLTDEEIHIKEMEDKFHNESEYEVADEEFDIEW
jgi:hypothetical protein